MPVMWRVLARWTVPDRSLRCWVGDTITDLLAEDRKALIRLYRARIRR